MRPFLLPIDMDSRLAETDVAWYMAFARPLVYPISPAHSPDTLWHRIAVIRAKLSVEL